MGLGGHQGPHSGAQNSASLTKEGLGVQRGDPRRDGGVYGRCQEGHPKSGAGEAPMHIQGSECAKDMKSGLGRA